MRIAITINTSWNIYNFRSGLIRALLKEGHEVIAIAPRDDYSLKLSEMGCRYVPIEMENTGVNPIKDLQLLIKLKKVYKQIRPDIILHYTVKPNIYGTLAASSLNIPVINNVSGLGTVFLSHGISSSIAKWLYKIAFKKAALVFFQNRDDQKEFLSQINLPNLKHELLPGSGIDLENYKPHTKNRGKKFVFLMVARIIIDKGVIEFAEAARILKKKYPNTEFQLLGQLDENHKRGISFTVIEKWVAEDIINYLGVSNDVKKQIAESDCVVLPSYREGTPKTLLEAAAMAKPIVTCDVPGCREVVKHSINGYLCQVKNASDLASKMEEMYSQSEDELGKMGQNGRKLVQESFDESIVIEKYLKHTSNIIN